MGNREVYINWSSSASTRFLTTLKNFITKPALHQTPNLANMRFAIIATLALGVAALPSKVARDEPVNILSAIQENFEHAPVVDGAAPFVVAAAMKRDVAVGNQESSLVKRALVVDVWQDSDKHGRHEGLFTDSMS
jgi:hypothetical protein